MAFSFQFIAQRLRHASLAELLSRFRQMLEISLLRAQVRFKRLHLPLSLMKKEQIDELWMPELFLEDDAYCAGILDVHTQNQPPKYWQTDIESLKTDIRIRWEPARLQQATLLMVIATKNEDGDSFDLVKQTVKTIVLDWIKKNPFLRGEHYISAMECALRIPVFFYVLKQIESLTSIEFDSILDTIYNHALLISKKLSLFSSCGNHTITEAVGLVFAGAIFRTTKRGKYWLNTGMGLLSDELLHQVYSDGGPAEQSVGYHRFVLDLYWLAMDFIQKNGLGEVAQWKERLTLGESFLSMLEDQSRVGASVGDSDNGFAIAQGLKPLRLTSGPLKKKTHIFKDSGYSIMKDSGYALAIDHGPLGMPPLHNHGHADALAIWLAFQGKPFFVDSGTYRYNGVSRWRQYFKGTQAHNTVTIDGKDQAVQETSFVWSNAYKARLDAFFENEQLLFWSASHDGYSRLEHSVRHYRSILYEKGNHFLIRDFFKGSGSHHFQVNYHLHPDVLVSVCGKWLQLSHGDTMLFVRILEGDFQIIKGQLHPILGWYSPHYGKKQPTTVLTSSKTGRPEEVVFTTAIFSKKPS